MADEPEGMAEEAPEWGGDDAWADAWIARNRDAITLLLAEAYADIEAGRVSTETAETLLADARRRWAARDANGQS